MGLSMDVPLDDIGDDVALLVEGDVSESEIDPSATPATPGKRKRADSQERRDESGGVRDSNASPRDGGKRGKGSGSRDSRGCSSPARGAKGRGQGRKPKKGMRVCSSCGKDVPGDLMPRGSPDCRTCKRIWNCIYNACERQGQLDWYHDHHSCPKKRRRLVLMCKQKYPGPDEGNKKKACNILTLQHSVRAESGVDKTKLGEMMWIEHAIHHFQKPKNGGMDIDDIKDMFKRKAKEPGAMTDQEGPSKAPFRVWFKTKKGFGSHPEHLCQSEGIQCGGENKPEADPGRHRQGFELGSRGA